MENARLADRVLVTGAYWVLRFLVWLYTAVVLLISVWAWVVEILMRQSATEHLLPATLLTIVTMPVSLLAIRLVISVPSLPDAPFAPLVVLTLAGMLQVGCLLGAQWFFRKNWDLRRK
jgi:hypothetical protein